MMNSKLMDRLAVSGKDKIRLKDYSTSWDFADELAELGKSEVRERAEGVFKQSLAELAEAQQLLYADDRYSLLVILQAMDAAGKDGTIKHVMSGVNPQGCQVYSFKQPSAEELDHNFLWRYSRCLPERGRIGIFNRSYYEEVLVVKVRPEILAKQPLPEGKRGKGFWEDRYEDINAFEKHLVRNGTLIVKFFLHISKEEQKKRFLDRLNRPEKNWKFCIHDLEDRTLWASFQDAYEEAINATSTTNAPWYIIPADQKWVARTLVASVITRALKSIDMRYPLVPEGQKKMLDEARRTLENEK